MRLLLLALLPAVAMAAPKYTLKPDSSVFVDDAFALRTDGKALAWIATDGAQVATLHLSELGGPTVIDQKIDNVPNTATALRWLSPTRVLIIWREPESQALYAQAFSAAGPDKERLGPAELIELGAIDGKPAVITYARIDKGRFVEHQLAAWRADTMKPLPRKILKEDKDGMVPHAGGAFHPLWIEHNLSTLMVKREGQYDKAKDMKRPDRLARYDLFSGKLHDEQEIADLIAFVHVNAAHGKHAGEDRFAQVTDDRAKLMIVDGVSEREVALEKRLSMYDPDTLRYQPLDDGKFALSLSIDPVNPAALQRQKADRAELDLYVVDGTTAAPRFHLDTGDRPASWQLVGNQLVVLRKSKGFDRGGVQLEVYDLP